MLNIRVPSEPCGLRQYHVWPVWAAFLALSTSHSHTITRDNGLKLPSVGNVAATVWPAAGTNRHPTLQEAKCSLLYNTITKTDEDVPVIKITQRRAFVCSSVTDIQDLCSHGHCLRTGACPEELRDNAFRSLSRPSCCYRQGVGLGLPPAQAQGVGLPPAQVSGIMGITALFRYTGARRDLEYCLSRVDTSSTAEYAP